MTAAHPRVLLVGRGHPETGGIAVFLDELRTGPLGAEADVDFLNLTRDGDMGDGGSFSLGNLRRTVADVVSVWRRAGRVDIVHVHSALAPTVTMIRAGMLVAAARLRRRPVVVHAHGGRLVSWIDERLARPIARLSLAPASSVIAVAEGVATTLEGVIGADRVERIPNGVDLDGFTPPSKDRTAEGPTRIVYVGHLSRRKGVLDLAEAGRLLRRREIDHELAFVGGRPDEGEAERQLVLDTLTTEGTVVGAVDHDRMASVYAAADIFCLPSWWEAMPLSVLEAMASGLPVVASAVGDVPRLVEHGVTGLLVEPRSPAALADALQTLLADPALRRSMGDAGRRRVQQEFDLTTTHRAIARTYRSLT